MVSAAVQKHNFRPVSRRVAGRRKTGNAENSLISSHFHTLSGESHCIKDVVLIDESTTRLIQENRYCTLGKVA